MNFVLGTHICLDTEAIFRQVQYLLRSVPPWLHASDFGIMRFSDAFDRARALISSLMASGIECHVGMTQNLSQRWNRKDISALDGCPVGYKHRGYSFMVLLYAGPRSAYNDGHKWQMQSSGAMERALIAAFRDEPLLLNRSPGGEMPTPGCPHFTYVACVA